MKNIIIYGDGIIGKLAAIVLSDYFDVYLISRKKYINSNIEENRYFSINLLSKFMFMKYGLWDLIKQNEIIAYNEIITWHESLNEDVIFKSSDICFDHLAYVINEKVIRKALDIIFKTKSNVFHLDIDDEDKAKSLKCEFLINSSYLKNDITNYDKFNFDKIDYGQKAIVMNLVCDPDIKKSIALQRFDKGQIQGLLPISKNQYNLIWSADTSIINTVMKHDDNKLLKILNNHFEEKIGKVIALSSRSIFPLLGFNAKKYFVDNSILIGGAAHSVHPMAGLGLNMGIQDIYTLNRLFKNKDTIKSTLRIYEKSCVKDNTIFFKTINSLIGFYTGVKIPDLLRTKSLFLFNENKILKQKSIEIATGLTALKLQSRDEYCKPSYK